MTARVYGASIVRKESNGLNLRAGAIFESSCLPMRVPQGRLIFNFGMSQDSRASDFKDFGKSRSCAETFRNQSLLFITGVLDIKYFQFLHQLMIIL
jgi:hypothetical protein